MKLIKVTSDSLDLNTLLKRAKNSVSTVEKQFLARFSRKGLLRE